MAQHHPIRAALWMLGAILSFSLMAVAGRELGGQLDTFEIMLFRSAIGIFIVLVVAGTAGTMNQINSDRLGLHAIRNLSHFAGQNLWFFAVTLIPLSQLFALEFSYPIIVALVAPLILGERLTRMRVLTAVIGFVGILIVARPFGGEAPSPGLLAALCAAFGFAGSALATKLLTRSATITCILFWLTVMQFTFGLISAGWDGDIRLPSAASMPWVMLVACCGLGGHFCLTTALSLAPATVVTPMDFLRLPLIAIVGVQLYNEPLDPAVLIGGLVIFAANWSNIHAESRFRNRLNTLANPVGASRREEVRAPSPD